MSDRKKDLLYLTAFLALLILFFSKILFTDKIIRAPDILNEAYWWIKTYNEKSLADLYSLNLKASWDHLINSGFTNEGGMSSMTFLLHLPLILHFFPAPASVAWFIVLHLFFGGAGAYCCCRLIGTSRPAALLAGLVFALSTENASLINAGHVMKIATISYAPWAFYCLEKGFLSRRIFWFMATALVLAFQFFNTHWQVAYYTCLCVGLYGMLRTLSQEFGDRGKGESRLPQNLGLCLVVLAFFLTTVSISLVPLANWSKETNRGAQSGANQGTGGLNREEAMSWSLPPEETAAFVIPGFFGFSRQEEGPNPTGIGSYYWGRMVFTQTASYMGLLPWLLLPLPLIFRRDRYTWLALIGIAGGILFSMGKYTPLYNLLFDYFPGINRFRVPKMIMFIPVFGLGVLSARGLDLLLDEQTRAKAAFRRYLACVAALPVILLVFLGILHAGRNSWLDMFFEAFSRPTRYEQGSYLVAQRWNNILIETGIAAALAALCACAIICGARRKWSRFLPLLIIMLFLADVWRVNDKFMFLVEVPHKSRTTTTPVIEFIKRDPGGYRTLPLDGSDPMKYVSSGIPVMFASNPVQQVRWQNFLDSFSLDSSMPDMLNVKYVIYGREQYQQDKTGLTDKYQPVFQSPGGGEIVLENRRVLPKAWLVSTVLKLDDPQQVLAGIVNPAFDPRTLALVEGPAGIPLGDPANPIPRTAASRGDVQLTRYEGERISLTAAPTADALLVLGEKYYRGWKAMVDGRETPIVAVDYILRGVYLPPGKHTVEFVFDPLPFKIGKYLTLGSFALFAVMLGREWLLRRRTALVKG